MKFRNPETREIENDINAVGEKYCNIKQIATLCKDCELERLAKSRGFKSCVNFQNAHPHEAARLMGYEVVEDAAPTLKDAIDKYLEIKQEEASMDKPRICELLGVEVDEEFTYNFGENQVNRGTFKIGADGNRYYKAEADPWNPCYNEEDLLVIINHPDRIIRKPRFTEQEVEDAKKIKYLLPNAIGIGRQAGIIMLYVNRLDGSFTELKQDLFPSIQPGQEYTLDDIIGGAE